MSRHACINLIFLLLRHVMIDVRMLPKTLANIHTRGSPWKFTNRSPPRNPIDNHSQILPLGGISELQIY